MSTSLRQDVYDAKAPGMLVADVESSRIEKVLPPEVQYACRYWIDHVQKSRSQIRDYGRVHCFLRQHFLHWLEALGWIGKASIGVYAITVLESSVSVSTFPTSQKLLLTLGVAWGLSISLELSP
jgi:hypothetical protein